MSAEILSVRPRMSLREFVDFLRENRIHGALVADGQSPVGFASYTDVLTYLSDHAEAPEHAGYLLDGDGRGLELSEEWSEVLDSELVEAVMTPQVLTCSPADTAGHAAARMLGEGVHRMAVEEDGRIVGILSATDLLKAVERYEQAVAAAARQG